ALAHLITNGMRWLSALPGITAFR
ncbi:hypothetical protein EC880221_3389, partial [Escherichia coli 88.0221]